VRERRETITAYRHGVRQDSSKIGVLENSPFEEDREIAARLQEKAKELSAALKRHLQKTFGHYLPPQVDLNRVVSPLNRPTNRIPAPPKVSETIQEMLDRMGREDRQLEAAAKNSRREAKSRLVPKDEKL